MRRVLLVSLFSWFLSCIPLLAQASETETPQTARQALIEMFLGKGADDFAKHLPEDARRTLIRKGETPETSLVLRIAEAGRQLTSQGERVESFDAGPNILIVEQAAGRDKLEVAIERDSLIGEADEIELSIHFYRDGQPAWLPVVPRLIFTLQPEKDIWRLTEVTAAAHFPLTDPDYLKGLRKQQDESNEAAVQSRLSMIGIAEKAFAGSHADRGYTCSLTTLFNPDSAPPNGGTFYDPGQGNDEWNGYRFTLSACEGSPAAKYRVLAAPIDSGSEMKTFCTDDSGATKFVSEGNPASCFSRGQAVSATPSPSISE